MKDLDKPWQSVWPQAVTTQGFMKSDIPQELKNEIIIFRAIQVHGDKYTYEHLHYGTAKEKMKVTCPNHGIFEVTSSNLISNGRGCPRCSGNKKSNTEEFITKAKSIHGNDTYDYSLVKYVRSADKVTIVCKTHGPWDQTANSHIMGNGCPRCFNDNVRGKSRALEESVVFEEILAANPNILLDRAKYKTSNDKMVVGCSVHGYWEAYPSNLLRGHGCLKCAGKALKTTKEFIEEARQTHGTRYSYEKTEYTGADNKLIVTCKVHGDFLQPAKKHSSGQGCPECAGKVFGVLYLLKLSDNVYKIGITNNLNKRLGEIKLGLPSQYSLELVDSWDIEDTMKVEQGLLKKYTNKPEFIKDFSGYTELRVLTEQEVEEICLFLETI